MWPFSLLDKALNLLVWLRHFTTHKLFSKEQLEICAQLFEEQGIYRETNLIEAVTDWTLIRFCSIKQAWPNLSSFFRSVMHWRECGNRGE